MRTSCFASLPSGLVLNINEIEYFCGVNAVRKKGARKPSAYTFSIQFLGRDEPITLSYETKQEAEDDYNTLTNYCFEYE